MKLDLFLQSCSKYCAYIPGVSALTAGIDAVVKKAFTPDFNDARSSIKNRYIRHLSQESWKELGLKAIPIIGNIAAIYWDIQRQEIPKPAKEDKSPVIPAVDISQTVTEPLIIENAITKEKSDIQIEYKKNDIKPPKSDTQKFTEALKKSPLATIKMLGNQLLSFWKIENHSKTYNQSIDDLKEVILKTFSQESSDIELSEHEPSSTSSILDDIQKFNQLDLSDLHPSNNNFNDLCKQQVPPLFHNTVEQLSERLLTAQQHIRENSKPPEEIADLINLLEVDFSGEQANSILSFINILKSKTWGVAWGAKLVIRQFVSYALNKAKANTKAILPLINILLDVVPQIDKNNILEEIVLFFKFLHGVGKGKITDKNEIYYGILCFAQKCSIEGESYIPLIRQIISKLPS